LVADGSSTSGLEWWRSDGPVVLVEEFPAVVAAPALEWPEKPRAAIAANASSSAVAAPVRA